MTRDEFVDLASDPIDVVVHQHFVEKRRGEGNVLPGTLEPALHGCRLGVVSFDQSSFEFREGWWVDPDEERVGEQPPYLPSTVEFDVEDHDRSRSPGILDRRDRRAIEIPAIRRPFDELTTFDHLLERVGIEEVVVDSVDLTRTGTARGRRHREDVVDVFGEPFEDRGLADTRGAGDDDERPLSRIRRGAALAACRRGLGFDGSLRSHAPPSIALP